MLTITTVVLAVAAPGPSLEPLEKYLRGREAAFAGCRLSVSITTKISPRFARDYRMTTKAAKDDAEVHRMLEVPVDIELVRVPDGRFRYTMRRRTDPPTVDDERIHAFDGREFQLLHRTTHDPGRAAYLELGRDVRESCEKEYESLGLCPVTGLATTAEEWLRRVVDGPIQAGDVVHYLLKNGDAPTDRTRVRWVFDPRLPALTTASVEVMKDGAWTTITLFKAKQFERIAGQMVPLVIEDEVYRADGLKTQERTLTVHKLEPIASAPETTWRLPREKGTTVFGEGIRPHVAGGGPSPAMRAASEKRAAEERALIESLPDPPAAAWEPESWLDRAGRWLLLIGVGLCVAAGGWAVVAKLRKDRGEN